MRPRPSVLGLGAGLIACLALWTPGWSAAQQRVARVVVVVSYDDPPYQQALLSFRRDFAARHPGTDIQVIALHGSRDSAEAAANALRATPPTAVLALGAFASRALADARLPAPVVGGMLLGPSDGPAGLAGVVHLEFSAVVELAWLQRLLPRVHRVGVVYSAASDGRIAEARAAAAAAGLVLDAVRIRNTSDLSDALTGVLTRSDVLWSVSDPLVYNSQTARTIVLMALRAGRPFIGQSHAWVKAGALFALDRDYEDVGSQCAELVAGLLDVDRSNGPALQSPRRALLGINQHSAAMLGEHLPAWATRDAAVVVR